MLTLLRYGQAIVGPVGSAGAQFLLTLQLLHVLTPASFGAFAFLMVAFYFAMGLWSALFCAPLPIAMHRAGGDSESGAQAFFIVNLILSAIAFVGFALAAWVLAFPAGAAAVFGAHVAVALLRWFARAHAYATGRPLRTMASDMVYATTLLAGAVVIFLRGEATVLAPSAALLAAVALGLAPFGSSYFSRQFLRASWRDAPAYRRVWMEHARWSVVGVISTEATANAHAYIVTLVTGPAAFAPLAASALLIRPVGVVMNALSEFERPRMARDIAAGDRDAVRRSVRQFRLSLIAVWVATVLAGAAILLWAPRLIIPPHYTSSVIVIGGAFWLAVAGVRLLRMAESTLLQGAGEFRPLALASVWSSGISIFGVVVLLAAGGPLWSIAGVLAGEAAYAVWIWRAAGRWRRSISAERGGG